MKHLTEAERAYRRGALQAVEFMATRASDLQAFFLSRWVMALRAGRVSMESRYLGTYMDSIREDVDKAHPMKDVTQPPEVVNSLQRLPEGDLIDVTRILHILYTNHRGLTQWRRVVPLNKPPRYDMTEHHKDRQWLLECWDLDKQDYRTYAMECIHWIMGDEQYQEESTETLEQLRKQYEEMPNWRK